MRHNSATNFSRLCDSSLRFFCESYIYELIDIKRNEMTICVVTRTPKASGVSILASAIVVIGAINLAASSVTPDHLVADTTLLFKFFFSTYFIFLSYQ